MFDFTELMRTIHGHVGILAAAALAHPAFLLRPGRAVNRGLRWAAGAATTLVLATFGAGWALYPGYRRAPKPQLLREAPGLAWSFETKEHLAFYAVTLAVVGAVLVFRGPSPTGRRAARWCYGTASLLAFAVAGLGSAVGSWVRSP